jgi:outer membrane protein TolC
MNTVLRCGIMAVPLVGLSLLVSPLYAQTMSFDQVLQRVVDHYPSLRSTEYQVEKARQESIKVESTLGWQLNAQGGVSHDLSLFGAPSDTVNLAGSLARKLDSGASLSFNANINRIDSDYAISPSLPNPATTTSLDVQYRQPLQKGVDNPDYVIAKDNAAVQQRLASAERASRYDQVASQLVDIYLGLARVQSQIANTGQAIARSQRLKKYIARRFNLGLAEDKDRLQVEAQLKGQAASLQTLKQAQVKQVVALNRLMGREPQAGLQLQQPQAVFEHEDMQLLPVVQQHSPALKSVNGRLQLAENSIRASRDARKDQLDMVMYLGNKTNAGDTATGSLNDSEVVGGVRLEYNRGLDRRGDDARLYQAQLDRYAAISDKHQVLEDLKYNLASLLADRDSVKQTIQAYVLSVSSEQKKLKDAERRYRQGRTDTDQLLQFEAQLSAAELNLELQRIELLGVEQKLRLLSGQLWDNIQYPALNLTEENAKP